MVHGYNGRAPIRMAEILVTAPLPHRHEPPASQRDGDLLSRQDRRAWTHR